MKDIKLLKELIESHTLGNELLIFVNNGSSFLSNQYIKFISDTKGLDIEYVENLDFLSSSSKDIFGASTIRENILRVLKCETFYCKNLKLKNEKNIIIVCNKYDSKNSIEFNDYVIQFPTLEEWMIRDYVYSVAEGVDPKDLDWLIKLCGGNIDRLSQEVDKLSMFEPTQRKRMFKEFVNDKMFGDMSEYNIFNITNALQSKDVEKLKDILPEIENIDVEAVGLVKLLWQNFKKLIMVWLNPRPTPENTGLKSNQIYAISRLPRVFSKNQLIDIFEEISEIDYKLKSGYIPADTIVDYLILKVLSI